MVVSHHQNVGQNDSLLTANKYFENVAKFKYLRTVTNHNCFHEEILSQFRECLLPFSSEPFYFPSPF
jgi:hypothetical protein